MQRFVTLNMSWRSQRVVVKLEQRGALIIAYHNGARAFHQLEPADAHHLLALFDAHQLSLGGEGDLSVGVGCGSELPVMERFEEGAPPKTLKPFIEAMVATLWRLEPAQAAAPARVVAPGEDDDLLSWMGMLLATVAFGGAHMVTYSVMTWRFAASFDGIYSEGGVALWLAYLLTGVALARIKVVREGGRIQRYTAPILGMCVGVGWALLMRDQLLDGMPTYALLLAAFAGLYCGSPSEDETRAQVA